MAPYNPACYVGRHYYYNLQFILLTLNLIKFVENSFLKQTMQIKLIDSSKYLFQFLSNMYSNLPEDKNWKQKNYFYILKHWKSWIIDGNMFIWGNIKFYIFSIIDKLIFQNMTVLIIFIKKYFHIICMLYKFLNEFLKLIISKLFCIVSSHLTHLCSTLFWYCNNE